MIELAAELLTAWGATEFIFKPVLETLAKDASKDWAKGILKDSLNSVISLPAHDRKKVAGIIGNAIKEFLTQMNDELDEGAGLSEEQIKEFNTPLKQFLKDKEVIEILGSPFATQHTNLEIDIDGLSQKWSELNLFKLPEDFRWRPVGKRYAKTVKKLILESDKFRPIWEAIKTGETAEGIKELVGVSPGFNLETYRGALLKRYGNLDINFDAIDSSAVSLEMKLWSIFIPQTVRECREYLPQVYELPKEIQKRLQDNKQMPEGYSDDKLQELKRAYHGQPVQPVTEAVDDIENKYMVILGDPGSGKSTFMRYLALKWARKPLSDLTMENPLPLLIELRTYARDCKNGKCDDIIGFCHNGNVCCRLNELELEKELKKGKVLALFDGLDEIFDPAQREEALTAIERFSNDYPDVRIIVTSRIIGYKPNKLRDVGFRHFMLQDLNEDQIEEFIVKWHEQTYKADWERDRKEERLKKAIEDSQAIRQLAGNPLLLTMMAILNRNQELPRDRAELYKQSSRLLLHQWDIERQLEDKKLSSVRLDYRDKQTMLRRIAYFMQSSEKGLAGNMIHREDLENLLRDFLRDEADVPDARSIARLLIDQLRFRNFILCDLGGDWYAFVHRTFLEYFCASAFVEKFGRRGQSDGLGEDQMRTVVFGGHWTDESWHEVLKLIAGLMENVAGVEFVENMIRYLMNLDGEDQHHANLFLAAECLNELRGRNRITDLDRELLDELKMQTQYDLWYFYELWESEAVQLVRSIRQKAVSTATSCWKNNPETLVWLKSRATEDDDNAVRSAAVQELARGWKSDPETLAIIKSRATEDENRYVRRAAVQELARGWKSDPETLAIIKSRATEDENWDVRRAAVQELARGWKSDPETLAIIKSRATEDDDNDVRSAAVQELARGWKSDPETLAIIKSRATEDDANAVRRAAVQELARGWKSDPETLAWLKSRATEDDDNAVRRAAVQELARGWKSDPETLAWLKSRATEDENWYVRSAAVQELARGWKSDPETLAIIKSRATEDDDNAVRSAAVQELARGWKSDPETLAWLKSRATEDEWDVRSAAVQELARGWKSDPETLAIIKSRATEDDANAVRRAAVQELARGWKSDPETLAIIKSRATEDDDNAVRRAAVQELARGWKSDPETLAIIKSRATEDENWDVRSAAVQELARGWKSDPETLAIIKSRATEDDDNDVRRAAVQELARGWRNDPEIMVFLEEVQKQSENPS